MNGVGPLLQRYHAREEALLLRYGAVLDRQYQAIEERNLSVLEESIRQEREILAGLTVLDQLRLPGWSVRERSTAGARLFARAKACQERNRQALAGQLDTIAGQIRDNRVPPRPRTVYPAAAGGGILDITT